METNRVLLPVFARYIKTTDVEKKEAPEDFSFMPDSQEYEMFRKALDDIPGSREYLKNYVTPENSHSFNDPIGNKIMMNAGVEHSGNSVRGLAWTYKGLLNDWDGWVLKTKTFYAKTRYEKRQHSREDTWEYDHAVSKKNALSSISTESITTAIQNLRTKFSLTYSDEEICELMDDLIHEFNLKSRNEAYEREKREFDDKIELLEHHYNFPKRWEDYGKGMLKSSLFGSIFGITQTMYAVMESRHPGYRQHIKSLMNPHHNRCACGSCLIARVTNGTEGEYSRWVREEANNIFEPREPFASRNVDNTVIVENVLATKPQ